MRANSEKPEQDFFARDEVQEDQDGGNSAGTHGTNSEVTGGQAQLGVSAPGLSRALVEEHSAARLDEHGKRALPSLVCPLSPEKQQVGP